MNNLLLGFTRSLPFSFHWLIVMASGLTILASLGLGRFSFGMVIPDMSSSLSLSYSQVGVISGANFVGFFLSVLSSPYMNQRYGQRVCAVCGLSLVVLGMAMMSFGNGYIWFLVWYTLSGFGSGLASLTVTILIANWFQQGMRGRASGYITMGSSLGIVISGLLIPAIAGFDSFDSWRMAWLVMSGIAVVILVFVAILVRNIPAELELEPKGGSGCGTNANLTLKGKCCDKPWFLKLGLCYGLFGAGYMTYSTFIVTALVSDSHFSNESAGKLWALIGLLSLLSGPLFGRMADIWGIQKSLAAAFGGYALSYALAGIQEFPVFIYASIFLFGICAWSVPAIMGAAIPAYSKPEELAKKLSLLTLFSSLGQILGPSMSGVVVEMYSDFPIVFWAVGGISTIGALIALALPNPKLL